MHTDPVTAEDQQRREGDAPLRDDGVPWRPLDALAVFALSYVLVVVLLADLPNGQQGSALGRLFGDELAMRLSLPLTGAILALTTLGYVALRFGGRVSAVFGPRSPTLRAVAAGVGYALIAIPVYLLTVWGLTILIEQAGGQLPAVQEEFREAAQSRQMLPYLVAAAVVLAPVGEELFFRGMLFQALRRRFHLWPAIGLSALAFALVHAQATLEGTGLVFLVLFPLGMFLAWVFHRRGTLVTPVLVHVLFNLVGVLGLRAGG